VDDIAFDRLTRLFSSPQQRRGAIRTALGFVLGGALIGRSPHALADDNDDELAGEAIAGGRGALGSVGGGSGGRRRGKRGRHQRKRGQGGQGNKDSNGRDKDSCAKVGEKRKDGKPCCKGLERDANGHCAHPLTSSQCDPNFCPRDQSTNSTGPGICCESGFCSCGGACCSGPDCWVLTTDLTPPGGEVRRLVVEELCTPPDRCFPCGSNEECCSSCNPCIPNTQRRASSIRRR
jgi:hypothetical protein